MTETALQCCLRVLHLEDFRQDQGWVLALLQHPGLPLQPGERLGDDPILWGGL